LIVALLIFAVTIVVSLLALFVAPGLRDRLAFRPYMARRGQWYTAITHGFVHADVPHLLFNMITFYFFGFLLAQRIGGAAFGVLYFVGLVGAISTTYFKHRNDPRYGTLGASGAISAVLFAAIVYFPTMSLYLFFIPIPIPAPLFAVLYVAYSWYAAAGGRFGGGADARPVNHEAHLVGALVGLGFVLVTDPKAYPELLRLVSG
jgi:membrane associated rhomboid family serine protease